MRQNLPGFLRSETKSAFVDAGVLRYLRAHSSTPDKVRADLAETTAALGSAAEMQVPAEQGTFLSILAAAVAPRFAIEIGTFTGYSSLCIARGLPPEGRLLCLDINDEWTSVAREHWKRAGVEDRIELRLGPATETLAALPAEPTFGLAFIDADKTSYITYYEQLMPRMLPGGLILVDNVLQYGEVVHEDNTYPSVVAMRHFNEHVVVDPRVETVMLPLADGLTIARKLP
ncbi:MULTISPECIES: O-methyltransferase [Pseudofrankia]|uniref:O-methyltransferase n=1 Tax=Pseudofrankia TaxID=2994363 RepID=UPI000685CFEE|nr:MULTISPECIES: class I SAM-dependent methyltransferase [Pseudofrankia]OHV36062.1 methyltransferase [Pseudofrankia sp. EUN1h]